jgi:hypothetical protein
MIESKDSDIDHTFVMPSDCRFREDLIELKKGDEDSAQRWKEVLEEIQRGDR